MNPPLHMGSKRISVTQLEQLTKHKYCCFYYFLQMIIIFLPCKICSSLIIYLHQWLMHSFYLFIKLTPMINNSIETTENSDFTMLLSK